LAYGITIFLISSAAEKVFGYKINSKGFKVLNGCGIIHGDGITTSSLRKIIKSTLESGFSAQNVCFGMGAGLLQKVNRDTMSFATKLCYIKEENGNERNIMKTPKGVPEKNSLPGRLAVCIDEVDKIPKVLPLSELKNEKNLLQVVYDNGKMESHWPPFDTLRETLEKEWNCYPKKANPISSSMKVKMNLVAKEQIQRHT
jgi:nicotinamide phosphoribosyltransferase